MLELIIGSVGFLAYGAAIIYTWLRYLNLCKAFDVVCQAIVTIHNRQQAMYVMSRNKENGPSA